ncbi:MAG: MMPL family transporter [Deltaproteobacteria bacterium]|nr:MMPL family transporter [Deltaproteobacteria bacterium]
MLSYFWKTHYLEALARFVVRRANLLAIIGILLTGASLFFATRLSVDSNYMAFLPEDFPGVQNLKKVIKKTGSFGNFMIVTDGAYPEAREQFVEEFALRAKQFPWVDNIQFKKGWEKIEKNKFLYLSVADLKGIQSKIEKTVSLKKGESNPFFISFLNDEEENSLGLGEIERKYQTTSFGSRYFEDPERQYTIAIVWPKGSMTDINFAIAAYQDLDRLIGEMATPGIKASIGGEFRTKIDEYQALKGNVAGSALAVLGVIALLLYLFYRKRGAILYTLIPLVIGSSWAAAAAYFLVGRLNLLTVFLVAILMGLGMDYGVYFFSSYLKLRRRHRNIEETIAAVWHDSGRSTASAAVTSALSFLTLVFMDFKGFNEFGLLSSIGILLIYIAFFIYSPVIWILAERHGFLHVEGIRSPSMGIKKFPLSNKLVWGGLTLSLLGIVSAPFITFEYDYSKLRNQHGSYKELRSKIHKVFPLSKTPAVVIVDNLDETRKVVGALEEMLPRLTTVDTVKSILDFIPENTDEKKTILKEIKSTIDKNWDYMPKEEQERITSYLPYLNPGEISLDDIPAGILRPFLGRAGTPGNMILIFDRVRLSDAKNAMRYAKEIGVIEVDGKKYYPAEGSLLFAKTLSMMIREAAVAFAVILAGVYLILLWDFRDLKKSLTVFLPLGMGLAVTLGAMAILGIKLNIFNLVIFPILIGLGVDSSLHFYHQFENYRAREELSPLFLQSGSSLLLTSLLNMAGFGSMMFTGHAGLKSMGLVAVLGMTANLLICFLFFPSFLKWRLERK